MARSNEDDSLEPILPRHPPTAAPPGSEPVVAEAAAVAPTRVAWERLVLVACAVVATFALVVCAVRLNSIAKDQRLQACQVRVYAEEQLLGSGGRPGTIDEQRVRQRFADCVGIDLDADSSSQD